MQETIGLFVLGRAGGGLPGYLALWLYQLRPWFEIAMARGGCMPANDDYTYTNSTRMRILNAVMRPLEDMTVNEICKSAGISRPTFYKCFESKYDIASWWTCYCEQYYLDKIGTVYSWEEGMIRHVRLLLTKHAQLARALSGNDNGPIIPTVIRRKERLFDALSARGVNVDELMEFCVDSYATAKTNSMTHMLASELHGPPLTITPTAKKLVAIIPSPLYDALQLPEYAKRTQCQNLSRMDSIALSILNESEGSMFPVE